MLENTESQEMYLTTIYALQKKNGMVRSVDVADERGYGAVRGESKSYMKNTNAEQARRFQRMGGDLYDEPPPYDDLPF